MSKYRRAAKIDANQPEIVDDLKSIPGVTVALRHDDILVGRQGMTFWFEIKKRAGKGVRPGQKKIKAEWTGHYAIVSTLDEILEEIGITRTGGSSMPGVCLPRPADGLLRSVVAAAEGDGASVRAEEGAVKG
jgi:hypothetical protein